MHDFSELSDTATRKKVPYRRLRRYSDELLMEQLRCQSGDALAVLFDRYRRLVFHIALKILRDAGEAEDVMQLVFLEIYRAAARFNPAKGTAKAWILQYAYHRSMNRRQYLAVRKFYSNSEISELEGTPGPRPGVPFAPQETSRLVEQSLRNLNAVQRRVLTLAYFEGYSLREIADETGESIGNVRHHYYRGLAKLRAILTERTTIVSDFSHEEIADASA